MSEDREDPLIGQVMQRKNEAEQELTLLCEEARKFGRTFSELAASLNASPEYIVFEGQQPDVRYYTPAGNNRVYKLSDIDASVLMALTDNIRSALLKIARLQEQVSGSGGRAA